MGYILIFVFVVSASSVLYILRKKRIYFEKQKQLYSHGKGLPIEAVDTFAFAQESFVYKNGMFQSKAVEVSANVYWQSVETSQVSLGGAHTFKYDAIFFKSINKYRFRFISGAIQFRLRVVEDNTDIPTRIMAFLAAANLSIDSGRWGVVLVRNKGPFLAEEIDKIVEEFMKLTESFDQLKP